MRCASPIGYEKEGHGTILTWGFSKDVVKDHCYCKSLFGDEVDSIDENNNVYCILNKIPEKESHETEAIFENYCYCKNLFGDELLETKLNPLMKCVSI
ncbi:hypothetical protein CEXT_664111 [Caerostris extrusa]|uniref:Uncharacterized protein n=1 Tax=Caerostris extrusa TaxID=172846 RepID=A0AAV4XUV8_CAEEX|nr:hypothetical protein CEXT_664111 [Caerostris extrusa]